MAIICDILSRNSQNFIAPNYTVVNLAPVKHLPSSKCEMDYEKSADFGTFSALNAHKLISGGGKSVNETTTKSTNNETSSGSFSKLQSSSVEQLNSLSNSYSPRATYSTTIER